MKIVTLGGTAQVGNVLARAFLSQGHEIVILSRELEGLINSPVDSATWVEPDP
jgi:predicted dinucleotide-binding enzyme